MNLGSEAMTIREQRLSIFKSFGASDEEAEVLLAYSSSSFSPSARTSELELPLKDELHLADWQGYAVEALKSSVPETLSKYLVQLRFPIKEGISGTDNYLAATRRGQIDAAPGGLEFLAPAKIELRIHPTAGGHIPVIVVDDRTDFETMIRAIVRKNEPVEIPSSMGAAAVKGLNNWSRVLKIRDAWIAQDESRNGASWNAAFKAVSRPKAAYQDTLIILSQGPYSNTSSEQVGCTPADWLQKSLIIRLEHECAHYFCRRVYGSMHNNIRDELIADYAGIVAAEGHFRADWFLHFMGLNEDGVYDGEGRMQVYRGDPELPDSAWAIMGKVLVAAAKNLETADAKLEARTAPRPSDLLAICDHWLEALAVLDSDKLWWPTTA
ncbi:MAG: hypothetical protein CMQ15_16545 [Gammaproteobacteria bacterium]|nr:hypothetical protein [Gammaproteobacteria bacterium]